MANIWDSIFGSALSPNFVLASPNGSAGPLTPRALVAADIPNIAESQVTGLTADLALKSPLASPTFTGTPAAPTATGGTNTTQLATTAFVAAAVSGLGTGTVTSVAQSFTGGLVSVAGSPITTSGTLALTVAGTSGGVPYFSSTSAWASSALLASTGIVIGGGAGNPPTTNTQLTFSAPTLTVGLAGTSSGILALTGSTSGSATFTAPAIAGTTTNGVLMSNVLRGPDGTKDTPTFSFSTQTNTGIFHLTDEVCISANSVLVSLFHSGGGMYFPSGGFVAWQNGTLPSSTSDSGISRLGAASFAFGAASSGSTTGNLSFNKIIKYAAIATVSQGVPAEYATVDLTAQSAAIAATTAYAATATGMFRISWNAAITTAASTSSVLGGTNGFQILYTSPTDSVVKTEPRTITSGVNTDATNTTATAIGGCIVVYAKTGTNIQYQFDYTSVGVTAMVYELHVKVEAL